MPNALIEAMALGIPCISTNYEPKSVDEFIIDKKNGLICRKFSTEELSKKMCDLIDDNNLYNIISTNGKLVENDFTREKIYREWDEFISYIGRSNETKD